MRLRIFEPRYKRLVVEALKKDGTFGICLFDSSKAESGGELSTVGTLAKIIDFEHLDDGLLGISVTGLSKFRISSVRVEFDGLRFARTEAIPNWDVLNIEKEDEPLSHYLGQVYKQFPDLGDMYEQKFFDDASWVSQRWLEILPLHKQQFDDLTLQYDCKATMTFIKNALEK